MACLVALALLGVAVSGVAADNIGDHQSLLQVTTHVGGAAEMTRQKQTLAAGTGSQEAAPRLYIVSVTGLPGVELATKMQESWRSILGPRDKYVNICDVGCAEASRGQLKHIVAMEDSAFPSGRCMYNGTDCDGYRRAAMKYSFGLTHEVRRLGALGARMPDWWLVKDDDTYVHPDLLMAHVSGFDPRSELVSVANVMVKLEPQAVMDFVNLRPLRPDELFIDGGAGWLLSGALAERLVFDHGDRWLRLQEEHIFNDPLDKNFGQLKTGGNFNYDIHVPEVISWVPGSRLLNSNGTMDEFGRCAATSHLKWQRTRAGDDAVIERAERCFA